MNILVIGSGGREHALAEAYVKSKKVKRVLVVPGNGLMNFSNQKILAFEDIKMTDFENIFNLVKKYKVDLVDVAQDDVLALGFVDKFEEKGIKAFGPMQKAAEIEWSKEWARNFMQKYDLPIPEFKAFNDSKKAIQYVENLKEQPLFIKASGLAAGKGAVKAENKKQAVDAIKSMSQFGRAGETFLIEECMTGEEFSLFAICDGKNYVTLKAAQDHKTVYNCNSGPNTGGMGCITPTSALNKKILQKIEEKILKPFLSGMQKENRPYSGILYLGGMIIKNNEVKIVEFNARWGDPEAEVIIPSIKTDYLKIVDAVKNQKLNKIKINFDNKVRISIAGCSNGYPNDYAKVKGKEIFGLNSALKLYGISIYGAGIKKKAKRFFANGGRIFHLVASDKNIVKVRKKAYEAMSLIYIEGDNLHYRTDIGWREIERKYC